MPPLRLSFPRCRAGCRGIDPGDRHRHDRGIAAGGGVAEGIGRGQIGGTGAGRRQFVEGVVRVVAEGAIGVEREQRARRQRELRAERAARHRRHQERTIGIRVGAGAVVCEHVSGRDRGVLGRGDGVILCHRGVVLRGHVDHLHEARAGVLEIEQSAVLFPDEHVEVAVAVEVGEAGLARRRPHRCHRTDWRPRCVR